MLLNRFNFIVWSATPPEPPSLSGLPLGGNVGRVSSSVLIVPGEYSLFYLNIPNGISLSSATIALVSDRANLPQVSANVGALVPVNVPGLASPQYWGYASPPAGLKEEYYRLRIDNNGSPLYSNRLWCKPAGFADISALFSFRSARNLAYIPYELPELANFRQQFRLQCHAGNPQLDSTVEKYNGVTTGRVRTTDIRQNLYYGFTVENADALALEGFSSMLNHKDLTVNGAKFSLKTGYQMGTDSPQLATATFELWDSNFALVTRC